MPSIYILSRVRTSRWYSCSGVSANCCRRAFLPAMKCPGGTSAQSSTRSPPGTSNGLFVKLQGHRSIRQVTCV